jgi:probable rRNA maturation factor
LVIFQKLVAGLSEGSLNRFVARARKQAGLRGKVNVLVTGSTTMRTLNLRFRGQNKATDVLSFPIEPSGQDNQKSKFAGEVAISADIALQNAGQFGHSPATEIKILTLHGILHLAGWDHERDNGEMARKEMRLRRQLHLPSNLIARARGGHSKASRGASSLKRSERRA